ncbi:MAG TPA: acyltransferase family protein [Ilumatobacteraceae bacterium]
MSTAAPPRVTPVAESDRAQISRVPYLPGLDGLRALAVVAVMIYHANNAWLPGGFLGVEMFFVISGYLITLLLIAERERNYRISLGHFWLRRARRLLPAVFMMMLLVTIWTATFERDALGQLRGDVLAGSFYVSNWYQVWVGLGYTASGDFAPLRHLWSLAVEEQFYLWWPIVMILLLGRAGTRRVADVSRWLLLAALAITVAVALVYYRGPIGTAATTPHAFWSLGGRPIAKLDTLYLSTITRAGGLLLGSAFALVWRPYAVMRGPLRSKGRILDVGAILSVAALAYMVWTIHLVTAEGASPSLFRGGLFLVGLAMLVLIAAVTHGGTYSRRLLGIRPLVWVGLRSYGLYLYHWPIFMIIRGVAGNPMTVRQFAMGMAATVCLTELSFRWVERPIRMHGMRSWLRGHRTALTPPSRARVVWVTAALVGLALFAAASLATAPLKQNEIAVALGENERFTTDLLDVDDAPAAVTTTTVTRSVVPSKVLDEAGTPTTTPVDPALAGTGVVAPDTTTALDPTATTVPADAAAPTTIPPVTTVPVAQLGVITDMSTVTPLSVPQGLPGFPLIGMGDSVMLGAAEELGALGFIVDAQVSRQMKTYLPDMQTIKDNGLLGSAVVVHLGTNGSFSDDTLAQMMAILADVPVVVVLTSKADREWVAGNNAKVRALPASHPNVTVLDWEVLGPQCAGDCFYDDGIHLNQEGQNYYTSLISRLLGLA